MKPVVHQEPGWVDRPFPVPPEPATARRCAAVAPGVGRQLVERPGSHERIGAKVRGDRIFAFGRTDVAIRRCGRADKPRDEGSSWPKRFGLPVPKNNLSNWVARPPRRRRAPRRRTGCAARSVRPRSARRTNPCLPGPVPMAGGCLPAGSARPVAGTASWLSRRSTRPHWRRTTSSRGARCSPTG